MSKPWKLFMIVDSGNIPIWGTTSPGRDAATWQFGTIYRKGTWEEWEAKGYRIVSCEMTVDAPGPFEQFRPEAMADDYCRCSDPDCCPMAHEE